MRENWPLYHPGIPEPLRRLAETPPLARLRQVGMNCGCEYTAFPRFAGWAPYSRFDHSVGVGLIVWHFTGDLRQSAAGLLHDVATPVFAHTVDFLRGDHLRQESTESRTAELIAASPELRARLAEYGLTPEDAAEICDAIARAVAEQGHDNWQIVLDRAEAIRTAVRETTRPAVVIVTGKGDDAFMLRRGVREPYEPDTVQLERVLADFEAGRL